MIADVTGRSWQKKLLHSPSGPIEVLLHLATGWVLAPVPAGWIGTHSITGALIRETLTAPGPTGAPIHVGTRPRVWEDRTAAMLELEHICPDCYGVDLPAPCETCEGSGRLGGHHAA